jgi:hypothetical protein
MTYDDYEELASALIWHKQEKRITQARCDELLTALGNGLTAFNAVADAARTIAYRNSRPARWDG